MKNLPNVLSILRIVLSVVLIRIDDCWELFLILYFVCGITDILDGFLARRYQLTSAAGAAIDSLADFIFLIASLTGMICFYGLKIHGAVIIGGLIIAVIRVLNFVITKKKFNQYGMIHTVGNKLSGFILFFVFPFGIATGHIPFVVIVIPFLAALEETLLLLIMDRYNPNAGSLFDSKLNS
ncbi:CDP-alcohol phosphatidyltransferase family protein [Clostridium sp. E02]|uniref:CDP-alcohol phosphatidyltransferase family protein n=1 Tax=Clostridium sp. E02 TaxID=2487134 RepID=UPI000F54A302|nr:CDP-alcohol phosphatidyltransferase family protein [Clostridium sp. E02]